MDQDVGGRHFPAEPYLPTRYNHCSSHLTLWICDPEFFIQGFFGWRRGVRRSIFVSTGNIRGQRLTSRRNAPHPQNAFLDDGFPYQRSTSLR